MSEHSEQWQTPALDEVVEVLVSNGVERELATKAATQVFAAWTLIPVETPDAIMISAAAGVETMHSEASASGEVTHGVVFLRLGKYNIPLPAHAAVDFAMGIMGSVRELLKRGLLHADGDEPEVLADMDEVLSSTLGISRIIAAIEDIGPKKVTSILEAMTMTVVSYLRQQGEAKAADLVARMAVARGN